MTQRYQTVRDPQGSPSVLTRLPEPEVGKSLEVSAGWLQFRGLQSAPAAPYGKSVRKASGKVGRLLDYLGVQGGRLLDECLVREAGRRAFGGVELQGQAQFWSHEGDLPKVSVNSFGEITFVTGCCLFSAPAVEVRTPGSETGRFDMVGQASTANLAVPVESITCAPDFTAYEVESSRRLCWTIVQLMQGLPTTDGPRVRVVLDVPRTQYYLYALDGAQKFDRDGNRKGLISIEQCLAWFDEVDRRSERVVALCREYLAAMLGNRSVDVTVSNELDRVADYFRTELGAGRVPTLLDLVAQQYNGGDRIWRLLQWRDLPDYDVRVFNGRAYSTALLRSSLSDQTTSRFAIEVDNPSEGKIYEGVKGAAAIHRDLQIQCISVLPTEPFFAVTKGDEGGQSGMYQHDPGHDLVLPDGTTVTMEELLADLFPMAPLS